MLNSKSSSISQNHHQITADAAGAPVKNSTLSASNLKQQQSQDNIFINPPIQKISTAKKELRAYFRAHFGTDGLPEIQPSKTRFMEEVFDEFGKLSGQTSSWRAHFNQIQSNRLSPDVLQSLRQRRPIFIINRYRSDDPHALEKLSITKTDIAAADDLLRRSKKLLTALFPEEKTLQAANGLIESKLYPIPELQAKREGSGRWYLKGDHELPIAGSIKARGAIYAVLEHAEKLAIDHDLMQPGDDLFCLGSADAKALFSQHKIQVGSTGNLGLAIGIMAAALGFKAKVHMSADAKQWKIERLERRGVEVQVHRGDFPFALQAGRTECHDDPKAYFVDDEHSKALSIGPAVAALRLVEQLQEQHIKVDAQHPMFVYLPCGVGGAPSGIALGLRHAFGSHVHVVIGQPLECAGVLARMNAQGDEPLIVYDIGLNNQTKAGDGMAVPRASELAFGLLQPTVSGGYTISDEDMFRNLALLHHTHGIKVEPSAAAVIGGPDWLNSAAGRRYLQLAPCGQLKSWRAY